MKSISDKKNMFFGVILTYVAFAISLLGSLFVTPKILNNIGDSNYGLLSFCNSITSWLSLISSAFGASYIYFAIKEAKEDGTESRTNTIFIKVLLFLSGLVLLISLSSIMILKLSGFTFKNYTDAENDLILVLLAVSSFQVALSIAFSVFTLHNTYKKSFIYIKSVAISTSILVYSLNLIIAFTAKSIVLIAVVSVVSVFINGIANLLYSFKAKKIAFLKVGFKDFKKEFMTIAKYSLIILLSVVIGNLDSNLDKTLLGSLVDSLSVTIYQLSVAFVTELMLLSNAFVEVVRPTLFEFYRHKKIDEANDLFIKISKIQTIFVLLIIGGYLSCGYHFTILWIGEERISVFYYSAALFVSNIIPFTKSFSGEAYRANNLHKIPLLFSFVSIMINLFLSIFLLLTTDKEFAVWACIIGTIAPRLLFAYLITPIVDKKVIGIPIPRYLLNLVKNILLMLVAMAPSIVFFILTRDIEINTFIKFLIEGFSFVGVYAVEIILYARKDIKSFFNTYIRKREKVIPEQDKTSNN